MSILQVTKGKPGYLKMGLFGDAKSGKTFTAALVACGVHRDIGSKKPIAFYDSEGGSLYVRDMIEELTGMPTISVLSQSFSDLVDALQECIDGAADIFIADSVTHPWKEICKAYLAEVNENLRKKGRQPRSKLEVQDFGPLKDKWNTEWAVPYSQAALHAIVSGRAGDVWEQVEDEDTGKKKMQITGTKMKTEKEFGFEPSLLVEMEKVQVWNDGHYVLSHRATVLGDRFNVIDGQTFLNPTYESFRPHIARLIPNLHTQVDASIKTTFGITEEGDTEYVADRKRRTKLQEEIAGELTSAFPGQAAKEKKMRTDMTLLCLGTRSWTAVEEMKEPQLAEGLDKIRSEIAKLRAAGALAVAEKVAD